jgi:hypothetical protein
VRRLDSSTLQIRPSPREECGNGEHNAIALANFERTRSDQPTGGPGANECREAILRRERCHHLCGARRVLVDENHNVSVVRLVAKAFSEDSDRAPAWDHESKD